MKARVPGSRTCAVHYPSGASLSRNILLVCVMKKIRLVLGHLGQVVRIPPYVHF